MSVLEARGLGFSYAGRAVLRDVSLAVGAGELVGVIGPNGAGKTTLVRLLAGVARPQAGSVLLDGTPLASRSRREVARAVAVVPQDPHVEFPFTVLEIVLMGRAPYLDGLGFAGAHDVALARAALARLEIAELEDRTLAALSGGERQRVFLARALVQEPRALVLDEPTTHLDLRHQTAILQVVRERVAAGGLGAIAVLHDLNLAASACDRLVLLAAGRVITAGPPSEVLTDAVIAEAFGARVAVRRLDGADAPIVLPLPLR